MQRPFQIVPWDIDFLEQIQQGINAYCRRKKISIDKIVVIFPNNRPRYYLKYLFQQSLFSMPHMMTLDEVMQSCWKMVDDPQKKLCGKMDRIALLFKIIQELGESDSNIRETFLETEDKKKLGLSYFFNWGNELEQVLEECLIQNFEPNDLQYTETEVPKQAEILLGSLKTIFQKYLQYLNDYHVYTEGTNFFCVGKAAHNKTLVLPNELINRHIFIAGFHILNGTVNQLFRYLWQEKEAQIWLAADSSLFDSKKTPYTITAQWSCNTLRQWIKEWHAPAPELVCKPSGNLPTVHYFSGYDFHSQLDALSNNLHLPNQNSSIHDIAIVLLQNDTLFPLLHTLADIECNISLGYPLLRSIFFHLLETIFDIRKKTRDTKTYYQPVLELVRHPYVKKLSPPDMSKEQWQNFLVCFENELSNGLPHIEIHKMIEKILRNTSESLKNAINTFIYVMVDSWLTVETPTQMAEALDHLYNLLLNWGKKDCWNDLDNALFSCLKDKIIHKLKISIVTDTHEFEWALLADIVLQSIQEERVPFKNHPLTGLQILGALETRLLQFSTLHIMDMTEDIIPGQPAENPLLPESLRYSLGLPGRRQYEQAKAYNFYRLIAGAKDVYLYWQEGMQKKSIFDDKKSCSRFVEDMIWRDEQEKGQRIKKGESPLFMATPVIHPPITRRRDIVKTTEILEAIKNILTKKSWSYTTFDAYLKCPLKYYYQYICGLKALTDIDEGDDNIAVGNIVHEVLQKWALNYKENKVFLNSLNAKEIEKSIECLQRAFFYRIEDKDISAKEVTEKEKYFLVEKLPPESLIMLHEAGKKHLADFVKDQVTKETQIIEVEKELKTTIKVGGRVVHLYGRADRIDLRKIRETDTTPAHEGIVILDYKTNKSVDYLKINETIWQDTEFWGKLSLDGAHLVDWLKNTPKEEDILPSIVEKLPSLQLPYYMYLYTQQEQKTPLNAAFVALGSDGEEKPLLNNYNLQSEINQRISALIRLILLHLEHCPEFRSQEGKHCQYCPWIRSCRNSI